ncbi:hypothetical protein [Clostridium perfringens]|uniref:hypothetical protein n=1 Tax=Clostridium perfringens TaxID=1502 RepID=UPI001570E58A|nr:hypothetical protein [Clostridium perfringens]MDU7942666.1 hypothetical protein [Streptococcus salivarius]MDU7977637.1 hypothetical protein [Clostridioides difficile]MBI6024475.1 hypothetical protein [Clostridium perfringens]MBI6048538.1 hypothetical protein [Clostridium perfringens]MDK0553717.1 hypothetical protein [Clostridium perfringens]
MLNFSEIITIICFTFVLIDFIIWIIYHNKVKKYRTTGKERALYIDPNNIDYSNKYDREYLVYRKHCKIEEVTAIIPIILLIIEIAVA